MKKCLCMLVVLLMLLACAACGEETQPTETTTSPTEGTTAAPTESTAASEDTTEPTDEQTASSAVNYIQLSLSEADGTLYSLTAFDDDMGNAYVEYIGEIKKMGNLDLSVLAGIQAELEKSGMMDFCGIEEYKDGEEFGSLYIGYGDETISTANFGGIVPQNFRDAYAAMEAYFETLTADLEEYVPAPLIMGDVNPDAQAALEAILIEAGVEPLDSFGISEIMMDDSFEAMMGLSTSEGITSGTTCGPMRSSIAFSCMLVTLEDAGKKDDVAKDFAANVNWDRWVCVSATQALVATKDQMVLCLATNDELYQQFAPAIENSGWTVEETLTNS
jgi:hypothetical protein